MKILVTIILACMGLFATGSSGPISCPSPDDLDPCTCKRMAYGLHVVCANFNKNSDLVKAFKVLRDYHVQNVLLHNLNLTNVLPADIFEGLEISELRVEKSKLKFSQPAFTGLDSSLHKLNVAQKSMIKSSDDFSLATLPILTELSIKANSLPKVTNEWLNGKIPSVHTIILDDDDIHEIESTAFASLKDLKSISLADNRIKTVSRSMFPKPAIRLTKIDLSANEINSIPFDFFFEMPNLSEVILLQNDLQTLPERTWVSIWPKLERVILLENGLLCDETFEWLRKTRWPKRVEGICVPKDDNSDKKGKHLKDEYETT